ncbi:MAG: flagellar protein [Peptococcaceae bacterium]|nr:flagellar protein [Peptococcaceae bacterium]
MNSEINLLTTVGAPLPIAPSKTAKQAPVKQSSGYSFQDAVRKEIVENREVKLSAHAEKRLRERNITLAPKDLEKINTALGQAASKGAKESLIIYEGLALITNVRNKTIVTAIDNLGGGASQVFTNIDSAVIVG